MTKHVSHRFEFLGSFFLSLATAGTLAAIACAAPVQAQTAATAPAQTATPEFEAASIKPVQTPNPARTRDKEEGRRFSAYSMTLRELIMMAYRVDAREIAGGPAWMATDEYDIEAVADDGVQVNEHLGELLQKLMADRFQLAFHREQRMLPAYALTVAKGGSKLKTAEEGGGQGASCEHMGVCNFRKEPLAQFTRWLSFVVLDRPVVDKTGITGTFDFSLRWTPDESQFSALGLRAPAAGDNANAPPPLFEAIQEQLGLKLEPVKAPAEVLVIDHVERPTEN
jgi:uncharacterized protein (TIGR03435 family)